jgi:hypothetical protein
VPVLSLLARPIIEELRVAQREASQKRTASLARGLLELRQELSTSLAHQRRSPTPYLLAGRFDKLEVKDQRTALIES